MIDKDILQGNDFLKDIDADDVVEAKDFMKNHRDTIEEVNRDDFIYYTQSGTTTIMVTFYDSNRNTTGSRHTVFYRLNETYLGLSRCARLVVVGILLGRSVNSVMPIFPRDLAVAISGQGSLHDR